MILHELKSKGVGIFCLSMRLNGSLCVIFSSDFKRHEFKVVYYHSSRSR